MKRFCLCLMTMLALCGCAAQENTVATVMPMVTVQDTTVSVVEPTGAVEVTAAETAIPACEKKEPVTVNSVDSLLEAIAPGATILLEPGRYDLTTASNYGMETGSLDYFWAKKGKDYELTLTGVYDLTILGSGRENTELVTRPRYVNVLALDSCRNVQLEGFNAGHTDGAECAGGVVYARDCEDLRLKNVGLYGCGTIGLWADGCIGVSLENSEIYDCSYTGIHAAITEGLNIKNCSFHDIGDSQEVLGEVFYLDRCKDVTIDDCEVSDNYVSCLVHAKPGAGIELRDTNFVRNRVESAVFAPQGSGLVMDGCTFADNTIHRWFEEPGMTILDGMGKTWTEESLTAWYTPSGGTVPAGERREVKVKNVDQLIAAIAPDTEIILADGLYDLSKAKGYGKDSTDYWFWSEEFDGPSLVLTGVSNLVIRSESGDVTKCTLSAVPRYANVLSFRNCSNIAVQGITAGHTVEPGYCMGGVLDFRGCDTVLVENCGLYGCGILGIQAEICSGITVKYCDIYECSYGGIRMSEVNGAAIENCRFRDLGGSSMGFYECRDITVDGELVSGNSHMEKKNGQGFAPVRCAVSYFCGSYTAP